MKSVKTNRKVVKKRGYDNVSRAKKSLETQKLILETLVQLLVEQRGGEVPIEDIARKSGVSQRTIFRFFKDKKTLHEAMDEYLRSYLEASAVQMKDLDFVGFGKNAFRLFDQHESLTLAYLFSPFGRDARVRFRKQLTSVMIAKIVHENKLVLTPEKKKRLALITSLVNAKIWQDLREDFGYSGTEMEEAVEWALKILTKNV